MHHAPIHDTQPDDPPETSRRVDLQAGRRPLREPGRAAMPGRDTGESVETSPRGPVRSGEARREASTVERAPVAVRRVPRPAGGLDPSAIFAEVERTVGERKFSLWFRETTRFEAAKDGAIEVLCSNAFVAEWVSRHFRAALTSAVEACGGRDVAVRIISVGDPGTAAADAGHAADRDADPSQQEEDRERLAAAAIASPHRREARPVAEPEAPARRSSLRRLEDFVPGSSNHLAFDAARRLAEGEAASPILFIHGECGVGKTHLLQGICRRRRERFPRQVIRYVTAEQFTNEFLAALRDGTVNAFRKNQRRVDLLAIDDIHFLASKPQTQAEFLHTLDALGLSGGRVVLASDEHPRTIRKFSESLVSRFLAGMVVRIDRPDRTTRIALLRSLAAARGLRLAPAAEEIVAGRCAGSVREIEGAVTRLEAIATLLGDGSGEVGAILAERAFADEGVRATGPVRIHDVVRASCEAIGVEEQDLTGPGRHRKVVLARGVVVFLAREMTTLSFPEIARVLGRDTHSTVHTAARRTESMVAAGERVEPAEPSLAGPDGLVALGELLAQIRHRIRTGSRSATARPDRPRERTGT